MSLPEFHGRGVGTRAVREIARLAEKEGCETVRLRVFLENPARRLSLRLGFVDAEPDGGAVWMNLRINQQP